ncbi:MAG: cytochrome P450 [Deinococcales bacterium]
MTVSLASQNTVRGPKALPIVGNIPQLIKDAPKFFLEAQQNYGDIFSYYIGSKRVYFLLNPEDIKYVLQDNYKNYSKNSNYQRIKALVGEGLLTSEGETWFRNRRLAQPVFHRQKIHGFAEMMVDRCLAMLETWEGYYQRGEALNMQAQMMRLTLGIIGEALFSEEVSGDAARVSEALGFALEHTNNLILSPFPFTAKLPTPANLKFKHSTATLDEIIYRIIDKRRTELKAGAEDKGDLLSMLLQAQDADSGAQMNDKELRDEAMTLFLAGHETTATSLTWLSYLLCKHPEVYQKLQQEIDEVLAGCRVTYNDLEKLPYTRMVIDEALRLYPPAWIIGRQPIADDTLPSGIKVSKGQDISISPYVLHHHPQLWPEPERFLPERFLEKPSRFAYLPFGGGPRVCIGNHFALMEMGLVLVTVLQGFGLELTPNQHVQLQTSITLRPKNGPLSKPQKTCLS